MGKFLISLFLISISIIYVQSGKCAGCPSSLTDEDKNSDTVKDLVKSGVNKIYEHKKKEKKLEDCIELVGELQSGSKQVVAGLKYKFNVLVKPIQSKQENCAAANVNLSQVPTETCEIVVWVKPYNDIPESERNEITFTCPK